MATKPPTNSLWLRNIRRMRVTVERYQEPFLDRHAIERLFAIKRRAANDLMRKLPSIRIGNASAVPRQALADYLLAFEHGREYRTEAVRRERLREILLEAQRDNEARKVRFSVSPAAKTIETLPPTVRIAPGELHIAFQSVQDLCAQLFALSKAIASDVQTLEKIAAPPARMTPQVDLRQ